PFPCGKAVIITILGDGNPADELHDEVRTSLFRGPGVEDPGDMGMVHERQRLTLGLETGNHGTAIHAGLDNLQSNPAPDRLLLLGDKNKSHAPFANLFHELIGADDPADVFGNETSDSGGRLEIPLTQEGSGLLMGLEQRFDLKSQRRFSRASLLQIRLTLV